MARTQEARTIAIIMRGLLDDFDSVFVVRREDVEGEEEEEELVSFSKISSLLLFTQ